jgi:hypothetical protein
MDMRRLASSDHAVRTGLSITGRSAPEMASKDRTGRMMAKKPRGPSLKLLSAASAVRKGVRAGQRLLSPSRPSFA